MKFSTNFHKIADGIDVGPLLAKLDANPDLWAIDTRRQNAPGSAHHDTECIVLRGPGDDTLANFAEDLTSEPTPLMAAFLPEMHPVLDPILNRIGAMKVGRMLLARLKPGGVIDLHADEGAYAKAHSRFHIVLTSDEGNVFLVEDEEAHMQPGSCWWFAHRRPHTVRNLSDRPRVHLIVDFVSARYPVERQDQP